MTNFDDELEAMLSLALAESTAVEPPEDLRSDALATALAHRSAGRPVDAPEPCDPADGFRRTVADLHELLSSLSDSEWDAQAHPEHGTVRELMAHLVGVERLSARWLDPDDDVPLLLDHVESTRDVVDALHDAEPHEIARQWHEAALAVSEAAATGDQDRPVVFHDLTSSIPGFLVTRTFELWAHSMDIAEATGRDMPVLDPARMAALSGRLMAAVPLALAYRRNTAPGRTARFVLTGESGGAYTVPLHPGNPTGEPDVLVVADTIDLCRVAARRLRPEDLEAAIEGDHALASQVLAGLDAFARD